MGTPVPFHEPWEVHLPPPPPPPPDAETLRRHVDQLNSKADELERRVNEVTQFYTKGPSCSAPKGRKRMKMGGCPTKRMQELMRQLGTIIRQISAHRWAGPFLEPVDVEGLRLHDYYKVIKKPMDFSTIQNRMEAKDGNAYKNVREIYADVRLIFQNAITYNDKKSDVHVMAKSLLKKFEEKWLELLPKVIAEETRQNEEQEQALTIMQTAEGAAMEKMARHTDNEINELNLHLEELRELVAQRCRKMSALEKMKLGSELSTLSHENLDKALEIIAQNNPSFQPTADLVEIDMDAQSTVTLWRLKFFVKAALEQQAKSFTTKVNDNSKRTRL